MRAELARVFGGQIGKGVRIGEVQIINPQFGLENLELGDGCFVGDGVVLDITQRIRVNSHATISPRVVLLTHSDPGSMTGNELAARYPRVEKPIEIGSHCWIGAGAVILCGVSIGHHTVVGAGAVVTRDIPPNSIAGGVPAKLLRSSP